MTQLKLDPKFIDLKFRNGAYRIPFASYYDERRGSRIYVPRDTKEEFGVSIKNNAVCFARIRSDFKSHNAASSNPYYGDGINRTELPIPNRVYYKIIEDSGSRPELSQLEKYKWIKICKENKLLPSYMPLSTAKTGEVVLNLEKLTPSLLYLYLSTARNIGENPGFIKGMVYLVTKLKMNFYIAFVFLSKVFISGSGHHIIPAGFNRRTKPEEMDGIKVSLMIGLSRFVNDPLKYDERRLFAYDGICTWNSFSCSRKIPNISKIAYLTNAQELFNKHLVDAVMAPTDEEAIEHISTLIREKYVSFGKEE